MPTTKTQPRSNGKHPGGRPPDYKPEFCELAIKFLSEGYSTTALAGELSVNRATIYRWADAYPEFRDALTTGQAKSALWWEKRARELGEGGNNNAAIVIFALKNRVAEDWRDKTQVETDVRIEIKYGYLEDDANAIGVEPVRNRLANG